MVEPTFAALRRYYVPNDSTRSGVPFVVSFLRKPESMLRVN